MEIEFTEATGDDPMDTLIGQLEARTEYVITFMRALGADMDRDPGTNAFAFVIGSNAENALVVEGGIAGDGLSATATIWAVRDGRRADLSSLEIDGQIMHTLILD